MPYTGDEDFKRVSTNCHKKIFGDKIISSGLCPVCSLCPPPDLNLHDLFITEGLKKNIQRDIFAISQEELQQVKVNFYGGSNYVCTATQYIQYML
jgi:hypothetical protein